MRYLGEALLESRTPVLAACRALLAQAITGRLEAWRAGKASFDLAVDIQVGAGYTIIESDADSLRLAKWSPPSPDAVSRLRRRSGTAISAG